MNIVAAFILAAAVPTAAAHTARPAVLLLEGGPPHTRVVWTEARTANGTPATHPVLPEHCRPQTPPASTETPRATRTTWTVDCGDTGLAGHTLSFEGDPLARPDVVVRWRPDGASTARHLVLHPGQDALTLTAADRSAAESTAYLPSGMRHILEGWDHLAFVLGLVLVVTTGVRVPLRRLLTAVTGFTIGHSLTLGPAALGWVRVPAGATEACIALSILYLAVELSQRQRGPAPQQAPLLFRAPGWVAAGCGLLHGLGFAGALGEVGLPPDAVVPSLALFNLGVELGQLAFVGALVAALRLADHLGLRRVLRLGAIWLLGTTGAFWSIERTLSVLSSAASEAL